MFYDLDDYVKSDELTTQEKLDIIAERNKKNFTARGNVSNEGIATLYNKFTNPLAKERRKARPDELGMYYPNTPNQEFLDYLFRKDAVTSKDRASFKYKDEADDFTRNKHRFKEEQIGPNISNLAKGFLKNKDNIFLTDRDYDFIQDKLSKSKKFSEALVQETIDSGKKDGVSLGNIYARNAANKINTANVVANAIGVPVIKTYDTGLKAIQDLANGDATLLAETALRTAGISADIALNISSGLLPHEIAQTAGAIVGLGVDDNETYLQNLGKRLYDQFLTTQIPGYGDFEVTDTSLYKGLEKVVMTEEDRKALEGTAIDTGVEGLALTALIANPFGVTSAPFSLAMKVPSGIYKGANRFNSIVQLNGPLKKQFFPLIEKKIARVEKIKGRPLNNKELDEIQAIINGSIIDAKTSILGGVGIRANQRLLGKWKGGVTKDMQQYMLQQLDKYMANRAGNQYARQLNVKDKTSLPTTAQADVMDLTVQGGGSSGIQKLNPKSTIPEGRKLNQRIDEDGMLSGKPIEEIRGTVEYIPVRQRDIKPWHELGPEGKTRKVSPGEQEAAWTTYGITWANLTNSQRTNLQGKKFATDTLEDGSKVSRSAIDENGEFLPPTNLNMSRGQVNLGQYGGDRPIDIEKTKQFDAAANFLAGGTKDDIKKTYADYLTDAQINNSDGKLKRGTDSQHYVRKFIIDGKFKHADDYFAGITISKQSNVKATKEGISDQITRAYNSFVETQGRYPTQSELHFHTFGYIPVQARGTTGVDNLVDHSKIIRNLEKDEKVITMPQKDLTEMEALVEGRKLVPGTPEFEKLFAEIEEKIIKNTSLTEKTIGRFSIKGHALREEYYSRVPYEIQEKLIRPTQFLTSGQNIRHIHYEDNIIGFYILKEETHKFLDKLKEGKSLTKDEKNRAIDLGKTIGIKTDTSNQPDIYLINSILKGVEKNLDAVDNLMLEDKVYTVLYDPISQKERIFGQAVGSKFDPMDSKRPKSDQGRIPPDYKTQLPTAADAREYYRRQVAKDKGETTALGQPLAEGGPVTKATTPEKYRIRGNKLTSVGNPRQNLYGLDIGQFMEEQKEIDKGIIENEIPEGAYDPYEVARIIDREGDVMEEKRKAGYLPVGEEFQQYKQRIAETEFSLLPTEKKLSSIIEESRKLLNPGRPSKLKFSEIPDLFTQNPLIRQAAGTGLMIAQAPIVALKAFSDDVVGMLEGKGEGFDDVKKIIPTLQSISRSMQPELKNEEDYISVIQEIIKMQDAGINNLGYSFVDLLAMGLDFMADTNVQQKVKDLYDEADIEQPETFLGKLGALGIELGVPGGAWFKVMNRARTFLRAKGFNTFVDKSTDASGFAYAAQKVSNIAKRSAVLGTTFGVSDAVSMSRYSTVNELFEDPLLLSDKESIEGLSGRELALTNFRNRLRFGADGAFIGGLFPLVGPPAWAVTKFAAGEIGSAIGAVGKYVINPPMTSIADTLAGKSTVLTKAAEDAVAVITGMRPELTGPIGKTGQVVSESVQAINNFVGKQIVTRALLAGQDILDLSLKKGTVFGRGLNYEVEGSSNLTFLTKQLPDKKDWAMFSVNSYDPLKQNLARIDNVMGMFRDIGKLSKDAFFLSGEAKLFIKSNMRATEDYLRLIEDESYNLAQNFQKRYNKYGESKHIQNHYMDQVLGYLKGKVKLKDLAPELRETSKRLNDHLTALRKKFADLLPAGGMKNYMETNLREYMRKSFAMFTNPNFYPSRDAILAARKYMVDMIEKDPTLKFQAELAFPGKTLAEAIKSSAELRIAEFIETLRYEMDDPLIGMRNAAKKDLALDDLVINTGEELPTVIRKLLGEENNLKASVLQTAGSLSHQAAQKIALDKVAKLGLDGGWLFRTAEEARDFGKILNASQVKETGTGLLHTDTVGLFGAPEIVGQLNGFNMFDSALKVKIYSNLIAFKAMVQGGKTLYSPATQARNFGSASLFALNQGHIGGRVTVGESFKMIMDDIFGAGKNADPLKVIDNINRKIRLGVLDENIVSEELGAVLRELKAQETGVYSMTGLTNKIGNTQLTKLVQKMYAGGDNIWKWHGHEYVKSQLTGNIKSIDEISDYFTKVIGRKFEPIDPFTGKIKTVAEGIEEMAAYMIRETYPTYSRVPPVIQALRKFPFGNFISFPAEIMRTTFAATGLSLKHIASDNPTLRAMGYKGLLGQLTTLYGVGATTQAISSAMTGINEEQINAYTQFLGPDYMRFHKLIPITTKQKNGSFKAFDMSAYNPYDYMIAPIEGIITNLERMRLEGSPSDVDQQMFDTFYAVDGPLASLISPFVAETIGLEPFFDVLPAGYALGGRGGVTKSGSKVYDSDDDPDVKWDKSFAHVLSTVAPGIYSTGSKVYGALQADISQGQQINLGDQLFKLMGGSTIVINPNKALDYKVADIKKIRGKAFNTEHFFGESNWQNRPAPVLVAEFENIQDQAFKAQFEVYEMFKNSLGSGLLNRYDVEEILKDRGFSFTQRTNLIDGVFTPVTYSKPAMEKRADNIRDAYPNIRIRYYDLYPKEDLDYVIDNYKYRYFDDFIDPETMPEKRTYRERPELSQAAPQPDLPVPPVPDTGTPVVQPNQMAQGTGNAVNPQTGLTDAQSVYLSPTEKLYYQRNKGTV